MEKPDKNDAALLLRMPVALKEALQRQADINGRRITSEINTRLRNSLVTTNGLLKSILDREDAGLLPKRKGADSYEEPNTPTVLPTNDNGPAGVISDTDRAMLEVFRKLPVEKQLALLSLFR